jgi:hypothetical protein
MDFFHAMLLVGSGGLLVLGTVLLISGIREMIANSYTPKHTRSTYLPPKR